MKKALSLLLSIILAMAPIAEQSGMGLAVLPASQNDVVKNRIERALLESWGEERGAKVWIFPMKI